MKDSIGQILYDLIWIGLRLVFIVIFAALASLITGAFCLLIAYICYVTKIVPIMFYGFALPPMIVVAFTCLFVGFKILIWDDLYISRKDH